VGFKKVAVCLIIDSALVASFNYTFNYATNWYQGAIERAEIKIAPAGTSYLKANRIIIFPNKNRRCASLSTNSSTTCMIGDQTPIHTNPSIKHE
jgi:hypothetical protein